jgi:hypothetical protein
MTSPRLPAPTTVESQRPECGEATRNRFGNFGRPKLMAALLISAIALAITCLLVRGFARRHAVYALCSRVRVGMTRTDVESLLAPYAARRDDSEVKASDGSFQSRWWLDDNSLISVIFDADERVRSACVMETPETESIWDRLQQLFTPVVEEPGRRPPATSNSPLVTNPHEGSKRDDLFRRD